MKQEGDVPWQIAYHPYPQNLTDPYFWRDDTEATDNETAPFWPSCLGAGYDFESWLI